MSSDGRIIKKQSCPKCNYDKAKLMVKEARQGRILVLCVKCDMCKSETFAGLTTSRLATLRSMEETLTDRHSIAVEIGDDFSANILSSQINLIRAQIAQEHQTSIYGLGDS